MKSASPTDRPLTRVHHHAAIRARHRRAAISAAASVVVCGQRSSNCTLTTPNCRPKTSNRFHHRNQQYSVIALTDGTGAIEERYAYSAYGEPTILSSSSSPLAASNFSNRYTYTGREWDKELGFYHFRARTYDAECGRFCGRDPIGFDGGSFLLSAFLGGNPATRLDPSGLDWDTCSVTDTQRRRVPRPSRGGRTRVIRLVCTIRCSCYGGDGPVEYEADLPHLGMAEEGSDEARCQSLLSTYYPMGQCDESEPELEPQPDPVPIVIPVANPNGYPRTLPTSPRPWWPSWPRPVFPSIPMWIIPVWDPSQYGGGTPYA